MMSYVAPVQSRIIYIINSKGQPFPQGSDHDFALSLSNQGYSVVVLDRSPVREAVCTELDGVIYLPLQQAINTDGSVAENTLDPVEEALRVFKPALLIVAAPWTNAEGVVGIAKKMGAQFAYFVKTLARSNPENKAKEIAVARTADVLLVSSSEVTQQLRHAGIKNKILHSSSDSFFDFLQKIPQPSWLLPLFQQASSLASQTEVQKKKLIP